MPPRFVEVSHVIEPGMVTYPGLPVPEAAVIVDHDTSRERYGGKSEFLIASLHLCGNTGTYVDSPVHRHRGALDLAGLPLERRAPAGATLRRPLARPDGGPPAVRGADLRGAAVLVRTDFSQHWRTERYGRDNPFLTAEACDLLVRAGAVFVGIDSAQHRRHGRPGPPRPHHSARRRHPDLRAHDQPRGATARRRPPPRRPDCLAGRGDLPGPRLRPALALGLHAPARRIARQEPPGSGHRRRRRGGEGHRHAAARRVRLRRGRCGPAQGGVAHSAGYARLWCAPHGGGAAKRPRGRQAVR